jgi:hypothetical protein
MNDTARRAHRHPTFFFFFFFFFVFFFFRKKNKNKNRYFMDPSTTATPTTTQPTDLPLLFTPARLALAVLLLAAEETGLKGPVDEFLSYCFEEEDEHGDIAADVDRVLPLVRQEVQVRSLTVGGRC